MSDDYARNLSSLNELFPDMDKEVVDMVLRDNAGLIEPSVTILLGMNDPSYKPEEQEVDRQNTLQRDAELARNLAQRDLAASNYQHQQQQQQQQQRYPGPRHYGSPHPP
ncbi:hypothetical protein GGF37_007076, partial [Kickxella alabastrina]